MNFLKHLILALAAVLIGVASSLITIAHVQPTNTLGIATNQVPYKIATNGSTFCSAATSTLIADRDPARTSFATTNDSANTIYLCKATSTCAADTGIRLNANGGAYEQNDGYIGAYSCIATTATSTLTYTASD